MSSSKLFSDTGVVNTMSSTKYSPAAKRNLKELQYLAKKVKNVNQGKWKDIDYVAKAKKIVDLYASRQIGNYKSAVNVLMRLGETRFIKSGAADKEYDKVFGKYADAETQTGKLERESLRKKDNVYSATMILFKHVDDWSTESKQPPTFTLPTESAANKKHAIKRTADEIQELRVQGPLKRKLRDLRQYYIGSFNVRLDGYEMFQLEKLKDLVIRRDTDKEDFKTMLKIFKSKNLVFRDLMESPNGESYLHAMLVMKITKVSTNTLEFEPKRQKNKDTNKVGAYYMYSCTPMDLSKDTFKEAIQNMNYTKDECFINTLYDFYRETLLNPDRSRNVVTRQSILETINMTEETVKNGISIEDIVPFFVKHRLQLRVFDQFYHEVFKYDPPVRNHHNKAMYCMMANGHIYTLNHNIKRLEQKQDSECEDIKPLTTNSDYMVREDSKAAQAKMIDGIDDIVTIAKTIEIDDSFKLVNLIHRKDNLVKLLNDLREAGYNPGINFEAGKLTALKLSLNGIFFIIQTQQLIKSAIDGVVVVEDEATYNAMNQAMTSFNHKIFMNGHKSFYTELDLDVLDEYRTRPIVGNIKAVSNKNDMVEIDISKAYTSALSQITEIPIFNEFDSFRPYCGESIQPLNLYVVKNRKHGLITQDKSLVYGRFLHPTDQIVAVKTPSFVKSVDYRSAIQELYDSTISLDENQDVHIKKLIANVNIGLLEKCFNRKSRGYLFEDLAECQYYQAKMGGAIHMLSMIEDIEELIDLGLDDGLDSRPIASFQVKECGKPLYVLVMKAECQLKNGFRYIKELLLQSHNFKLMQAFDKLAESNIAVHSVKTDCFTIRASDLSRAQHLLSFDSGIGSWRVSKKGGGIIYPYDDLTMRSLKDFQYTKVVSKRLKVKDEWDTEELCDLFESKKRVMVRAEFAGCGKSYACKALEARGHKVLFVCPTNKLAQNNLNNGVTLHSFFGIGMNAEQQVSKFDATDYDVIVFDEIYFANIRMLARIKKYCEANPDKIIVATGDTNQLECIDLISNYLNYDDYMNHCIDTIFSHNVHLKTNKRLKSEQDRETLKRFKKDCFNESLTISQIVNKYFKQVDDIQTTNNIAYMNSTCESVSKIVRENAGKTEDYEVGEKLVCRKFVKEGSYKFRVNFEFAIVASDENTVTLKDESLNETVTIKKSTVQKNFVYSYCRTCHSFQGSSIDDKITIFDWRFKFVNRKWLYTAVTRATELKNVFFHSGKGQDYDDKVLNKYLDFKVQHYKRQDKDARRKISATNFITVQWLKDQFGKACPGCGDCLAFEIKNGRVESNLTADRFDNDLDHNLDNITPLCCTCNQRKSKW